MLSLLTLEKLVKLEIYAISCLTYKRSLLSRRHPKRAASFLSLSDDCDTFLSTVMKCNLLELVFSSPCEAIDRVFTLSLPFPEPANSNRFAKIELVLSLLWSTKFYRVLCDLYACSHTRSENAWFSYVRCFHALVRVFSTVNVPDVNPLPNTHCWLACERSQSVAV
jgi:hypothetical protein